MLTRVKDGVARIAIKAPESVVIVRGELAKKEPRDERDPSVV
jgi:sRNA-binding carbon storage regulator CsrA